MSKEAFEKKVTDVIALRDHPPNPASRRQIKKALQDRNNFLVSKPAAVVGSWREHA